MKLTQAIEFSTVELCEWAELPLAHEAAAFTKYIQWVERRGWSRLVAFSRESGSYMVVLEGENTLTPDWRTENDEI